MPSKKRKAPKKEKKTTGRTEKDVDKDVNTLMNKIDRAFMAKEFEDVAGVFYVRSRFNDGKQSKAVMGLRKSDKNMSETSELFIYMFMFICKKLGFKEDACKSFIIQQILEVNPEATDVEEALNQLLNTNPS